MASQTIRKVAVIAANGRTGVECVAALLQAGIRVRAGVHGSHAFMPDENLAIVQCDATNRHEVAELIAGCDAVVSTIGHGRNSPARLQTTAMQNCIDAMQSAGMTRLISITGTGVRMPGDQPSLIDRVANLAIRLIDPARIADGIAHAALLQSSSVDWTIVRVLKLTNGAHIGGVQFSLHGPAEWLTPRQRVAAAVVQLIQNGEYLRQAPIITGGSLKVDGL